MLLDRGEDTIVAELNPLQWSSSHAYIALITALEAPNSERIRYGVFPPILAHQRWSVLNCSDLINAPHCLGGEGVLSHCTHCCHSRHRHHRWWQWRRQRQQWGRRQGGSSIQYFLSLCVQCVCAVRHAAVLCCAWGRSSLRADQLSRNLVCAQESCI